MTSTGSVNSIFMLANSLQIILFFPVYEIYISKPVLDYILNFKFAMFNMDFIFQASAKYETPKTSGWASLMKPEDKIFKDWPRL